MIPMQKMQMWSEWVFITPDMARAFLLRNGSIRVINRRTVSRYAGDMLAGRWRKTHQGIAFKADGTLRDGQHRLMALIEANMTIEMMITYGLDDDAVAALDSGQIRNLGQVSLFYDLGKRQIPVTKFLMNPLHNERHSPGELLDVYMQHKEAVEFGVAHTSMGDRAYYNANTLASILARGWYTEDKKRLATFTAHLMNGSDQPGDTAATVFRMWYSSKARVIGTSGMRETYGKMLNAVKSYLARRPMKQLKANYDLFPIPE